MNRKRGLTIVELLVVLVVVAIAAALLYPVFGNAREASKRGVCMSNLRRIGRAISGYVAANDNTYPLAMIKENESWQPTKPVDFPEDWAADSTALSKNASAAFWANAIRGALGEQDYQCPQSVVVDPYESNDRRPAQDKHAWMLSYSFNGYLNQCSSAKIVDTENCIVVWEGQGKAATFGQARANPLLNCNQSQECVFSKEMTYATRMILPHSLAEGNTMWAHGRGANFLLADLHVRWRRMGATSSKPTDKQNDPFRTYDKSGNPTSTWLIGGIAPMFSPLDE